MKLQTTIPLSKTDNPIDYQSSMLLLGSCFVENMGEKLDYFKFQHLQNPFGILFHPLAIENLIVRSIENQNYEEKEVFEQHGRWYCFDAHSDKSSGTKTELVQSLNDVLEETRRQLKQTTHLIITLGTAWVYRNIDTKKTVANCHKVPQKNFTKELLSVQEIRESLEKICNTVQSINPKTQLVFTISPVRHLKDGFIENQRSKANLITAVHDLLSSNAKSSISYFESYEIMMDELRDYRFYGKDMVHPNELAVDYIWEKFKAIWISEDSHDTMNQVEVVQKGLSHRPFNPDSDEYLKFKKSLQTKITYLQERYPFMKFG